MRLSVTAGLCALTLTALPLPCASALAEPQVVQPVQVGAEIVRYTQGSPTLDLRLTHGAVQVRPLPLDHGSLAFSVAVFNGGDRPANIDTGNFTAEAATQHLTVFTVDELAKKAKNRAMWGQIGLALAGGLSAAAAASQRDTYSGTLFTPHGSYHSFYSAPSATGQVQATAITAGTAFGVVAIQNRLDQTLEALGNDVVQTSTIDPGQTYGGKIVLTKINGAKLPQRVLLTVAWNGEHYPFAFQIAKAGTPLPEFTALTLPEATRGLTTAPVGEKQAAEAAGAFASAAAGEVPSALGNAKPVDRAPN